MSSTSASSKPTVSSQRISTQNLVLVGMFAAVMAVISQISLPMPTGVPITIQVFGIALIGTVLGWKLGGLATIVYILLGAIGLPVFSSFRGGVQVLAGMAGG
jgi:biotin transport system substrate-specific component